MFIGSKRISLFALGVTALVASGITLRLFDDPEGPNLLIVTVMGVVVYFLSLMVYAFDYPANSLQKFLLALLAQLLIVTCAYFLLR
jgi:NhaP-type Na+/H+ or K+/H+ antiporter